MAIRDAGVTSFQGGQNTLAHEKAGKVQVKTNMSKVRNIGIPDMLVASLKGRSSYLPKDEHNWTHGKSSQFKSKSQFQNGQFGTPKLGKMPGYSATEMRSHTSAPGKNPLGHPDNARGGNPLGSPTNRRGGSALPRR